MPSHLVPCVGCHKSMNKVSVAGGVEIDCCDDHGVWLDRNELDTIIAHAQQQAPQPSSPGAFEGLGRTVVQGAASGVGWRFGSELASSLVRRIFG